MGIFKEFREFALKGNMVDMAVGIIIGGAFGALVASLVGDVMKPPLDYLVSMGPSTEGMKWDLGEQDDKFVIDIGKFLSVVIGFLITAIAVFILVKIINQARRMAEREKADAPPPAPPEDVRLLTEIRDLLARQQR